MRSIKDALRALVALFQAYTPVRFTESGALQAKNGQVLLQINAAGTENWREIGQGLAMLINHDLAEVVEELNVLDTLYAEREAVVEAGRGAELARAIQALGPFEDVPVNPTSDEAPTGTDPEAPSIEPTEPTEPAIPTEPTAPTEPAK